jgi:membrane protein required for colicin V production
LENLEVLDIIVVALIVVLGLKGLFRGVIKELFGLVGIIGGVFVASRLAKDTGYMINDLIPMSNENTILLVGFVASLVLFWILAYFLGIILEKIFSASGLGIFDKLLGFIFGAGKIFLLFSIIAYAVSQVTVINDALAPKVQKSVMFPLLKDTGGYIIKLDKTKLQNDVTKQFDSMVDSAKKTVEDATAQEMEKKAKELQEQLIETTEPKQSDETSQIKE